MVLQFDKSQQTKHLEVIVNYTHFELSLTKFKLDVRIAQMGPRAEVQRKLVSTKPHPQKRLRAASPIQLLRSDDYTNWPLGDGFLCIQQPVMAATGEQSCLKLTFVSLAIDCLAFV